VNHLTNHQTLKLRRLGIDTYTDPVLFMNRDCPIFGSRASTRAPASE
jgi:hypothetical protein